MSARRLRAPCGCRGPRSGPAALAELPPEWHGPVHRPRHRGLGVDQPRTGDRAHRPDRACPTRSPPSWRGWRTGRPSTAPGPRCWRLQPAGQHPAPGGRGRTIRSPRRSGRWTAETACGAAGLVLRHRRRRLPPRQRPPRPAATSCSASPRLALLGPLPRRALVGAGRLAPAVRPADPAAEREPPANYGCSPGRSPAAVAARRGQVAPRHACWNPGRCAGPRVSQRSGCRCCASTAGWRPCPTPADVLGDPSRAAAAGRRVPALDTPTPPTAPRSTAHAPRRSPPADQRRPAGRRRAVRLRDRPTRQRPAQILGPISVGRVTDAHAAELAPPGHPHPATSRSPTTTHYVDDHALAQITAALPAARADPRPADVTITRGDGTARRCTGLDDPQAMRMILLQILTGRRASEIRTCDFDCLSPATDSAVEAARRRSRSPASATPRARSTSRRTPSSSTREVVAVIEEQQQWLRDRVPSREPRYLFPQRRGNRHGAKPYGTRHLRLGAARVQRDRPDHRQQGPAGQAQPHPPVPAHQADPARRTRPARPRPAALRRPRHADHVDALHRPPRRARRAGVPGHRASSEPTAPALPSPATTTTACTCSTAPTGSCPTAGACCRRCRPATRATPA